MAAGRSVSGFSVESVTNLWPSSAQCSDSAKEKAPQVVDLRGFQRVLVALQGATTEMYILTSKSEVNQQLGISAAGQGRFVRCRPQV